MKLRNEESMRKKVESTAASAEEKAHLLESKLKHLSATAEREKKSLEKEVKHLREDSKLSISRLRADVSIKILNCPLLFRWLRTGFPLNSHLGSTSIVRQQGGGGITSSA